VEGIGSEADWGELFGADLTEREVRYLIEHEWARTAEDVLWRRSKLGLRLSQAEAERLGDFMREALAGAAAPMAAGGGAS
jgi:glycerol-3-phosphate dehydrogenase